MTGFKDMWAENEQGEKFLFTVEMQRRLEEQGLPVDPAHVPELKAKTRSYETAAPDRPERRERSSSPRREPRPKREESFEAPETIQIDPQTGKYIGRVKWYNMRKGYGFIVRGGGEEIFFHKSNISGDADELDEGQWILYDIEETEKGLEAAEVEAYTGDIALLA